MCTVPTAFFFFFFGGGFSPSMRALQKNWNQREPVHECKGLSNPETQRSSKSNHCFHNYFTVVLIMNYYVKHIFDGFYYFFGPVFWKQYIFAGNLALFNIFRQRSSDTWSFHFLFHNFFMIFFSFFGQHWDGTHF